MTECGEKDSEISTKHDKKYKRKRQRLGDDKEVETVPQYYLVARITALLGMTICLFLFVLQIGTSIKSYKILQELSESRMPQYLHLISVSGEREIWTWDAENEVLLVNTSLYVH